MSFTLKLFHVNILHVPATVNNTPTENFLQRWEFFRPLHVMLLVEEVIRIYTPRGNRVDHPAKMEYLNLCRQIIVANRIHVCRQGQ